MLTPNFTLLACESYCINYASIKLLLETGKATCDILKKERKGCW